MTDQHKAALAEGRNESRAVKRYLEALEANRPKRGRKRSQESIEKRLAEIETQIPTADPLKRVNLIQERLNLRNALGSTEDTVDMVALEAEFVRAAAGYSARKGLTYAAWRELGVEPALLAKAGITRGS
ncbi:MAG TPA: hypothetical protein VID05_06480 [Acidimicrobiales bacterium]